MNVCLVCYEETVDPVALCTTIGHVACKVCAHAVIRHATTTISFPLHCCGRDPAVSGDRAACPALLADSTIVSVLTAAELNAYYNASVEAAIRQAAGDTQIYLRTSCCARPFEIDRRDCPTVLRTVACVYGCRATMCTGCLQTLTLAELRLVETQQLEASAQPSVDSPPNIVAAGGQGVDRDASSFTSPDVAVSSSVISSATALTTVLAQAPGLHQSIPPRASVRYLPFLPNGIFQYQAALEQTEAQQSTPIQLRDGVRYTVTDSTVDKSVELTPSEEKTAVMSSVITTDTQSPREGNEIRPAHMVLSTIQPLFTQLAEIVQTHDHVQISPAMRARVRAGSPGHWITVTSALVSTVVALIQSNRWPQVHAVRMVGRPDDVIIIGDEGSGREDARRRVYEAFEGMRERVSRDDIWEFFCDIELTTPMEETNPTNEDGVVTSSSSASVSSSSASPVTTSSSSSPSSSSSSSSTQPGVGHDTSTQLIWGGAIAYSRFLSNDFDTVSAAALARDQAPPPAGNTVSGQGGNASLRNGARLTVTGVAADGSVEVAPMQNERQIDPRLEIVNHTRATLQGFALRRLGQPVSNSNADDIRRLVQAPSPQATRFWDTPGPTHRRAELDAMMSAQQGSQSSMNRESPGSATPADSGAFHSSSGSLIANDRAPTEGYALRRMRQAMPSLAEVDAMINAQQGSPGWANREFPISSATLADSTNSGQWRMSELAALTRVSLRDLLFRGQGMRPGIVGSDDENEEDEEHTSVPKVHDHMGPLCFRPELHEPPQPWMHLTAGDSERKWTDEDLLRLFRRTLDAWTPRCPRCRRVGLKSGLECNVIDCECGIQWCFACSKQLHHTVGAYLMARRTDPEHTALMMRMSSASASSSSEALLHDDNEHRHRPVDASDDPIMVLSSTDHHARFSSAHEALRHNPTAPGEGDRLCPSTLEQLAITYNIPEFVAVRDAYLRDRAPLRMWSLYNNTVQDGIEFRLMEPFLRLRGVCALRTLQSKLPADVFLRGLRTLPDWSRDVIVCTALAVQLDPTAPLPRPSISVVAPDPSIRGDLDFFVRHPIEYRRPQVVRNRMASRVYWGEGNF